ncbi:hypothetical protein V7183_03530 [Bacillus sp. JJ1127]|uniref:hypothetical protein n=1 Tax=Bacillus sp. JJ1127 TaxID=3122952 RepID=UPI0030000817
MNQIGTRIIYDQDGDIVVELGQMAGNILPRKEIKELNFIDISFGSINFQTHRIVGVDIETKQPILEEIPQVLTPEQQLEKLENELLLAADANVGGIL